MIDLLLKKPKKFVKKNDNILVYHILKPFVNKSPCIAHGLNFCGERRQADQIRLQK